MKRNTLLAAALLLAVDGVLQTPHRKSVYSPKPTATPADIVRKLAKQEAKRQRRAAAARKAGTLK